MKLTLKQLRQAINLSSHDDFYLPESGLNIVLLLDALNEILEPNTYKRDLYYQDRYSDKEYHVWIEKSGLLYRVKFSYGKRGGNLLTGEKTPWPVSFYEARDTFNDVVNEKLRKGYEE